jgi:hypothetical protein
MNKFVERIRAFSQSALGSSEANIEIKCQKKKKKRGKILRGLSCYYVDGVCEGTNASHVLINIDSPGECLRSASLKNSARSIVPCYSEVLLCNQRSSVTNTESESVGGECAFVNHTNLSRHDKRRNKSPRIHYPRRTPQRRLKITKHLIDVEETVTAYEFHKTEKQQEQNTTTKGMQNERRM